MFSNLLARAEKLSGTFWKLTGVILVLIVGSLDVLTGPELSFSLFYLIPIMITAWFSGRRFGLVISGLCTVTWFAADEMTGREYAYSSIRYWNAAIRLGFFVIVTWLLPAVKELRRERRLAHIDYLTGAANRRYLFEIVQHEIDRSQRYGRPFALAYLDVDDFKSINDHYGHQVGDDILCAIVNCAKRYLRKADTIARIGGDEFIIVFPETNHETLRSVVPRIQAALLHEMQRSHWPVTFSIGALSLLHTPANADECITWADDLMYSVKESGKNDIAYEDHGN
jgi:diguanylate cyclase (GGDEF)-like protein